MKLVLGALQWAAFMIAAAIVVPVAVAQSFHLDHSDSARLIQSTFFVLGIAAVIQCLKGHRLPINESPAGLWWGVYTIYGGLTGTVFATYGETLRGLQGALLVSAVCFFLLSVFKVIDRLAALFTPVVTGVYLLLLVMQLSQPIIKGLLGIGYLKDSVDGLVFALALVVVAAAFIMSNSNIVFLKQYSILLALFGGWVLFAAAGVAKPIEWPVRLFQLPSLLPFGAPLFNSGLAITSVFITILLIVNMLASMKVVDIAVKKFGKQTDGKRHERHAGFAAAFSHLLSGLSGAIAPVPISGAAGFIETTKMPSKKPFVLGSMLVVFISVIPFFMNAFASLPSPVGFAVNFVVFSAMVGLAFAEFDSYETSELKRVRTVIGISLLTGVGIMFVPGSALKDMHPVFISLLSNGLVLGTLAAIVMDQFQLWRRRKSDNLVSSENKH
ncbi:purine/pyrimidine permease [Bacillus mojavensis]|uniref:purine/pyrimidine permease n=1 Tax=Bacillus mojavensis TaxID=72360 RepID=UPI002DBCB541|nr:purine/pyrimidine permease [Bacillus mojavensis]MEC1291789.1 purine/pyrimidine permease [Bacillus mojavensis]MEC1613527.1 purine/pyrimidine permease [Bacillus mojavensis]MEC1622661.1 purine/pyrimidine permease [Bacillus mojavensis]MEC1636044.1 purine/pyrimidine permease [Bacillus mojavensis]MEC1659560.1 purine/pyrimidine permease [Bacillus mojavensis]